MLACRLLVAQPAEPPSFEIGTPQQAGSSCRLEPPSGAVEVWRSRPAGNSTRVEGACLCGRGLGKLGPSALPVYVARAEGKWGWGLLR